MTSRTDAAVNAGEVFWLLRENPSVVAHPHVVLEHDDRTSTVVVCALTSNLRRAKEPGNVLLAEGEAQLPKASVALAAHVASVDLRQLGRRVGALSVGRVEEIRAGVRLVRAMVSRRTDVE